MDFMLISANIYDKIKLYSVGFRCAGRQICKKGFPHVNNGFYKQRAE